MRRTSLSLVSKGTKRYSGNAQMYDKKSIRYGSEVYTWNPRFTALLDVFLSGGAIHNFADHSHDLIVKYVDYANGDLAATDVDYDMVVQFDAHLATLPLTN